MRVHGIKSVADPSYVKLLISGDSGHYHHQIELTSPLDLRMTLITQLQ